MGCCYPNQTKMYYTSTGEGITQGKLDSEIRKAKAKVLEIQREFHGYNFCVDCGKNALNTRLDCSHEKSVQWCKNNRQVELAYDIFNINIRCRDCHRKHDGL